MEHGSFNDQSSGTFSLTDEDHTLANALRFTLNQEFVFLIDLFSFKCSVYVLSDIKKFLLTYEFSEI